MQIVASGSLAFDRIMVFPGTFEDVIQPDKLKVLSISVLLDDLQERPGGTAGNIVYNLGLLGEKPVLLGAVGADAQAYMQRLGELGVDTTHVITSEKSTAVFTVMTDRNDCQVAGFYPGAMCAAASLTLEQWKGQDAMVIVSANDPQAMSVAVSECEKHHLRLCYDPGQQVIMLPVEQLKAGLAAAEILIVNDYELGMLAKRLEKSEAEILGQVKIGVVTLGDQGCRVYQSGQSPLTIPAVKVSKVVDPTGAGDAFRAGWLYGYTRGWAITEVAQLANVVASYAVAQHGGQAHTFTLAELSNRYQATYQQELRT